MLVGGATAGLGPAGQWMVLCRVRARGAAGQAVLVSLHDLGLAARFADRVVVMNAGRVEAHAPPLAALTPDVMARVFGLAARWVEGPDGPLLSVGRYSDGSAAGVCSPSSPA